jgi:hypothetical protein
MKRTDPDWLEQVGVRTAACRRECSDQDVESAEAATSTPSVTEPVAISGGTAWELYTIRHPRARAST